MLICRGVTVSYGKGRSALTPLRELALSAAAEPVALMGPSGSGKTTLLRVIAGLQQPDGGTVTIDGRPVVAARSGTVDRDVAMIYQDPRLVDFLDVEQNLALALTLNGTEPSSESVADALASVGLDGFERRRPEYLSGGEQQRVAIARAVLARSRVLLADEPTGSLDADSSREVARLLLEIARRHRVIVLVATHDPTVAGLLPRRVSLRDGALSELSA